MPIPRWNPPVELSRNEERILKLVKRHRKLFGFLRMHRHELFDDAFQDELETMYRDTGAGTPPKSPALMCAVLLLQSYVKASDVEAVVASQTDARWRLVLGSLDSNEPLFSQGGLQMFRQRLIAHDMDKRLLERTVELARKYKEFDWKKLPKKLHVGIDSRPLVGAGRVEDIFNLLGHAARKVVECASKQTAIRAKVICDEAGCPLFLASSVKAGLDIDWSDAEQKSDAINRLVEQVESLVGWVDENLTRRSNDDPVQRYLDALSEFQEQDLERQSDGKVKIRDGVAKDRRVSVEDPEMRHGRKSKNKAFNGYKEHVAADLNTRLTLACAVTPANAPEQTAAATLTDDIYDQGFEIEKMFIDRGYIKSSAVEQVQQDGGEIVSKPWRLNNNKGLFSKADFDINIRDKTITCPGGQSEFFDFGMTVEFNPRACAQCPLRQQCTTQALGRGRTIHILEDEALQKRLRKNQASKKGRERLRTRTGIEHNLAHVSSRKGPRARYLGVRKNEYDIRRASTVQNLEIIQRKIAA
ncbi:MAG: IS1182 family transposase [Proteobacteria bacterium]|nr:IS1182 family transposase [Pseudomonadota bacterium]